MDELLQEIKNQRFKMGLLIIKTIDLNMQANECHSQFEMIKQEKNQEFEHAVEMYEMKYRLPKMKKSEEGEEDRIESSFAAEHPVLLNVKAFGEESDIYNAGQEQHAAVNDPDLSKKKEKKKKKKDKK